MPAARIEHVTAIGKDRDHARFSLASGGARARGIAFRTSQRSLAAAGAEPHDAAVTLERNRWNGTVEARVQLDSLCPTEPGAICDAVATPGLSEAVAAELGCEPGHWWPESADAGCRTVVDRRGEGLAAVAGDLSTSGEPVLVVVADLRRRRETLERLVAGMAAGPLAVAEWEALAANRGAAASAVHLVALDPPPVKGGIARLAGAPGAGAVHLAWGDAERSFALAAWTERLTLRPALADVWRALETVGELAGGDLDAALAGSGRYPRDTRTQARMIRVLGELDLATWSDGRLVRGNGARTELERSAAHRGYAARLVAAQEWLAGDEYAVAAVAS